MSIGKVLALMGGIGFIVWFALVIAFVVGSEAPAHPSVPTSPKTPTVVNKWECTGKCQVMV